MNFKKKINFINGKMLSLLDCEDSERFYEITTSLYYHVNSLVFGLENKNLNIDKENKENVSDNRTDCN